MVTGPHDTWHKANTTEPLGDDFAYYYPLVDPSGRPTGMLLLQYDVSLVASNPERRIAAFALIAVNMAAPFVFILLFTLLFARRQ